MKSNNTIIIFNFIILLVLLFLICWNLFGDKFIPKKVEVSKIDSINYILKNIESNQRKLDSIMWEYNKKMSSIDENIGRIKFDKNQLMKEYNEKITRVNNFNTNQLDSFFSNRYK